MSGVMQRPATQPADLPRPEEIAGLTGLEIMRAILEGRIAGAAIAGPMGLRLEAVEEGAVTFAAVPEFAHTNPMGTVHGGWYGTLLDSAMGCAVMTTLPAGAAYTTLEYKVNLIRGARIGEGVTCRGAVSHAGRSTAVAEGRIEDAAGRLLATGTTTCLVMRP